MNISWHGLGCIDIETSFGGNKVRVITDPYASSTGIKLPRTLEGDIVFVSHSGARAENTADVSGEPFIVSLPGEYEIKGVFVYSMHAPTKMDPKHCIARMENEGIKIAYLGVLDRKLTNKEIEALGDIDILILPVGGGSTLGAKDASEVIAQVEPRVVIPTHHNIKGLKEKLATVDTFCKEMSACRRDDAGKFKVSRSSLPEEETIIVSLQK